MGFLPDSTLNRISLTPLSGPTDKPHNKTDQTRAILAFSQHRKHAKGVRHHV